MINLSLVISPQPKKVKAVLSWSASIEIKAKRFSAKAFLIFWFAYCGFYRVEGDYFRRLILPIECWLVKQEEESADNCEARNPALKAIGIYLD